MDFDDSPEEAAFRQECRTWLAANAKLPAELELSIAADDIARVITTRKGDSSYSVVSDKTGAAISSPTFTCKLDPDQQNYSIVHLQTP